MQSALRAVTLMAVPACRATLPLGSPPPLHPVPLTDPHFFSLGIRGFAVNDLVFSGHVGLFLLFLYATPTWPRLARLGILATLLLLSYGLLSTREHYTFDLLLAIPASLLAHRVATLTLHRMRIL